MSVKFRAKVLARLDRLYWIGRSAPIFVMARRNLEAIRTFTSRAELHALYRLAKSLPAKATILEIGSYLGASTCYLAAGAKRADAQLYCVDTWANETMPEGMRDTMADFRRNTQAFADRIILIRKHSAELKQSDVRLPIDLAFIDGDHSYEGCKSDFEIVTPWVKAGGVVAFHDATQEAFPGVPRVIGEALASGQWRIGGLVGNLFWIVRNSVDR